MDEWVDVPVSWVLLSVEASPRVLLIQYCFGGPIGPPLRFVVEDDPSSVEANVTNVTMVQAKDPTGRPSVGRAGQALVDLESPIAGRRVFGPMREQMRGRQCVCVGQGRAVGDCSCDESSGSHQRKQHWSFARRTSSRSSATTMNRLLRFSALFYGSALCCS